MEQEDRELNNELQARIFMHRFSILGAYLQKKFMSEELLRNPLITNAELKQKAEDYSMQLIQKYEQEGSTIDHYEVAYAIIAPQLPDNTNTLQV